MGTEKETTAPIPSVAPDGEQPFALTRNNSIPFLEEKGKSFDGMPIVSMAKLMEMQFPVKLAVIEGLLPAGTYLLAGAPKVGKSFFVLQMAYQVSTGGTFLGCSVHSGTVLYLALEDTLDRLQKRLVQMTEQDSPNLILSVLADTLGENLLAQLEGFLMDYPDTVLVIIDTLQRVRGRTPDSCSYAADYETLSKLKAFADAHGITLVLVHHTRKESAEDIFHTISGTNGLMGAADGALILHKDSRTGADAVLDVTGRDQQDMRLHLRFDPAHLCWELVERETVPYQDPPNPLLEAISQIVTEEHPEWRGTATDLAQELRSGGFTPNWIVRRLNVKHDVLLQKYGIRRGSPEGTAGTRLWDKVKCVIPVMAGDGRKWVRTGVLTHF